MDSLTFGVVLGYLFHYRPVAFRRVASFWLVAGVLLLSSFAVVATSPLDSVLVTTLGFTALYLGYGGFVALAGARPDLGREAVRPIRWPAQALAWLGLYSYTVYLAHAVIPRLPGAEQVFDLVNGLSGPWAEWVAFWTGSVVGGVALSHAVERPFLALRAKWFPSRRAAAVPTAAHAGRGHAPFRAMTRSVAPPPDQPGLHSTLVITCGRCGVRIGIRSRPDSN